MCGGSDLDTLVNTKADGQTCTAILLTMAFSAYTVYLQRLGAYIECNSYRIPKNGAIVCREIHSESARRIELHKTSPVDASTKNSKKNINESGIMDNARKLPSLKS